MTIEKFETYEAATQALWCFQPDGDYYRMVAKHFNLGWKLYPRGAAKGLFKYRSILEADNVRQGDVVSVRNGGRSCT